MFSDITGNKDKQIRNTDQQIQDSGYIKQIDQKNLCTYNVVLEAADEKKNTDNYKKQ